MVLLALEARRFREARFNRAGSELLPDLCGVWRHAGVCWPVPALLGHGTGARPGLSSAVVPLRRSNPRGLFDRGCRGTLAQLLWPFHVLVLTGSGNTPPAPPATQTLLD